MGRTVRNVTRAHLAFHTWEAGKISLDAVGHEFSAVGFGTATSLLNYDFSKRLGEPSGQLTLGLKGLISGAQCSDPAVKNGMPWTEVLNTGDWWQFSIERNGQILGVGLGKVDRVRPAILADPTGAPTVGVTVLGRDMGFGLEDTPLYFNPWDQQADNFVGSNMIAMIGGLLGPPHEVIRRAIQGLFGRGPGAAQGGLLGSHIRLPPTLRQLVYGLPPGVGAQIPSTATHWIDLLDLEARFQQVAGTAALTELVLDVETSPGSVWAWLETWRNPSMNELFFDIDPTGAHAQAYGIFRERPFLNTNDGGNSPWYKLPMAKVECASTKSVLLEKGNNRINHFLLQADMTAIGPHDEYATHPPVQHNDDIDRFGLFRLQERTQYAEDPSISAETQLRDWRTRILSWNALNHKEWMGRIEIQESRADIRIGQRIGLVNGPLGNYPMFAAAQTRGPTIPDDAHTFYVEAAQYQGSFGPQPMHTTQLLVSKGYREESRLRDLNLRVGGFVETQQAASLGPGGSPNVGQISQSGAVTPAEGDVFVSDPGVQ